MSLAADKLAYSVEEAVRAGPWGKTTLYELMASGELPWRKQKGHRYILREDFMTLLLRVEPFKDEEAQSGRAA